MSGNKNLRKQLKRPDAFQVQAAQLLERLVASKKLVTVIVVAIVAVVAAVVVVQKFSMREVEKRRTELSAVDLVYEEEEKVAAKQREELEKKITTMRLAIKPKVDPKDAKAKVELTPDEKKLEEQVKVVEAQIDAIEADHGKSIAQYKSFYDKYPKDPEGWAAGLRYASYSLEKGQDAEGARKILNQVFEASRSYTLYQMQAGIMLTGLLEDASQYEEALKVTDTLLSRLPEELKPRVLLSKGRIELLAKKNDEAGKTFDSLIEKYGESPEASQARSFKALIISPQPET